MIIPYIFSFFFHIYYYFNIIFILHYYNLYIFIIKIIINELSQFNIYIYFYYYNSNAKYMHIYIFILNIYIYIHIYMFMLMTIKKSFVFFLLFYIFYVFYFIIYMRFNTYLFFVSVYLKCLINIGLIQNVAFKYHFFSNQFFSLMRIRGDEFEIK
jgi:hypothetical protein